MSDHANKAEELAERAGGYLQGFEVNIEEPDLEFALAYAQAATAAATLSVAQRIADQTEGFEQVAAEARSRRRQRG